MSSWRYCSHIQDVQEQIRRVNRMCRKILIFVFFHVTRRKLPKAIACAIMHHNIFFRGIDAPTTKIASELPQVMLRLEKHFGSNLYIQTAEILVFPLTMVAFTSVVAVAAARKSFFENISASKHSQTIKIKLDIVEIILNMEKYQIWNKCAWHEL